MHIARIIFVPILVAWLLFLCSAGVVIAAVAQTVTNREQVKDIVAQRSLYESLHQTISEGSLLDFESGQDRLAPGTAAARQADTEAIKQVVDRYFTVDFYNRATTTLIDSLYDWLEGKTERPVFDVPLTDNQKQFQDFIAAAFIKRYQDLPACAASVRVTASFNPLEANCRVAGYDEQQIKSFIKKQTDQPEFKQLYESASLSSDQFTGDINTSDSRQLQSAYSVLRVSSWLLPLLILVTAGLIMLILYNRSRGFKTVGLTVLPAALILLLLSIFGGNFVNSSLESVGDQAISQGSGPIDDFWADILSKVFNVINTRVIIFSGVLAVAATALLVTNYFLNKRSVAAKS